MDMPLDAAAAIERMLDYPDGSYMRCPFCGGKSKSMHKDDCAIVIVAAALRAPSAGQRRVLPWAHPVRADLARGYIVDANDNYVCVIRASRSDEYNQEIAKALNAYASVASSATGARWCPIPNNCEKFGCAGHCGLLDPADRKAVKP